MSRNDLLSTALPRKNVVFASDGKDGLLNRRLENHTTKIIQTAATRSLKPSLNAVDKAMFLCEQENQKFNGDPVPLDVGLWTVTSRRDTCKRNLPDVLLNLYWRTRKQIAIFDVFAMIYVHGIFSAEALAIPVNYCRTSENLRNVFRMLLCFSKVADLEDPPQTGDDIHLSEFDAPIHWLAVMICRCCYDLTEVNEVISLIAHSQRLGHLSATAVKEFNEERAEEVQMATSAAKTGPSGHGQPSSRSSGKERQQSVAPLFEMNEKENAATKPLHLIFGLILPSGTGSDIRQLFHDANTRFVEIEKVFREFFQMTEQELAMEDEDDSVEA